MPPPEPPQTSVHTSPCRSRTHRVGPSPSATTPPDSGAIHDYLHSPPTPRSHSDPRDSRRNARDDFERIGARPPSLDRRAPVERGVGELELREFVALRRGHLAGE